MLERSFLACAVTVSTAVLGMAVAAAPVALADSSSSSSTITVNGTGATFVVPDVAVIQLGVQAKASTSASARKKANVLTAAVIAAVTKAGVVRGDVQTNTINLHRVTSPGRHGRRRVTFYVADYSLAVRTGQVGLVGPIAQAAAAAGANTIEGPDFSFSSPSAGKTQATRAALADARTRADDAAAAVGYKVIGVQAVVIDPQPEVGPRQSAAKAPAALHRGPKPTPTPVAPGRQEVDATVHVTYFIAPA